MIMIILYDLVFFMIFVGNYDFECWHVWAAVTWVMLSYASFQQDKMRDIKPERWICVVTTAFCHQNPALTQLCRKLSRCLWQPKMLVTYVCSSTFQFGCQLNPKGW